MKLPLYRRIFKNDYSEEYQDLVEKMAVSINNGFDTLFELSNKKVSLKDNVDCTVKTLGLAVDSNGIPTTPTAFNLDTTSRISGINVLKVDNLTNSQVFPTGAPFISFSQTDRGITINHITGLQPNYQWQINVVAYGN